MKPNKDGKFVFKSPSFESLFLPAPSVIAELLGLPANFVKALPMLESYYDKKLNVGRSSRANLVAKGVAKPTLNKLSLWLKQLPIPTKKLFSVSLSLNVWRAMQVGSNAGSWLSTVNGLKQSNYDTEFSQLMAFVAARSNADYLVLASFNKLVKSGQLSREDNIACWAHLHPTWAESSLVSLEQLSQYQQYVELSNNDNVMAIEQEIQVMRAVYAMRLDFYLAAIANYEVGVALYEIRQGADTDFESYDGLFSSVIHTYAVADEECTCFTAMLIKLRNILSRHQQDSSWRALASYIAIEESGDSEESLNDKQYRQLKDWRNGENMPSDKKLREFVEAVVASLGHYDIEPLLVYFRIARGVDTLVAKMLSEVKSEKVVPIIAETLASYPKYFEHYKQQTLNNQSTAA